MISAELSHNPYLLLTTVKFNGQAPRINSQIEKHEHKPLKDWAHLVPEIFYDEMNGYDFDLLFAGTLPDFEELKHTFDMKGISESEVRLIHKNEIENADVKSSRIDSLIAWLRENANHKFDFESFWNEHLELFEGSYSYIVLGGPAPETVDKYVGIETINSARELSSTVLTSTPILFCINSTNTEQFRKNLIALLARKDIRHEQLFFMLHHSINRSQITRTIEDLGVSKPQVVTTYFDESVKKYIRNYPVTEYIRDVIVVFETVVKKIGEELAVENEESIAINAGVHAQLDQLEAGIAHLKETDNFFVQRDNYVAPHAFELAKSELIEQLQKWRNRKTKIVGDLETESAASEYDAYVSRVFESFISKISDIVIAASNEIKNDLHTIYEGAQTDTAFYPELIGVDTPSPLACPYLKQDFISKRTISYEDAKGDFFGLFKKSSEGEPEKVRVVTSYLEQWRALAEEQLLPLANQFIAENATALSRYYSLLAEGYHEHLTELLTSWLDEKDQVASDLSDDEKKLQQDNDWLATFRDQLQAIERD